MISTPDLDLVRSLFQEYAQSLDHDLSFQNFAQELESLPGLYAGPGGVLFLCRIGSNPAGCVGVKPWEGPDCEMKRLFIRPDFQGRGLGRELARAAIDWAIQAGYRRILLDTMPTMTSAVGLYTRLGFRDIPAYRFNPVPGARYMALDLA